MKEGGQAYIGRVRKRVDINSDQTEIWSICPPLSFLSFLLEPSNIVVLDEADVVLESEGSVVLVDGEAEDVGDGLAVLFEQVVLTSDHLRAE